MCVLYLKVTIRIVLMAICGISVPPAPNELAQDDECASVCVVLMTPSPSSKFLTQYTRLIFCAFYEKLRSKKLRFSRKNVFLYVFLVFLSKNLDFRDFLNIFTKQALKKLSSKLKKKLRSIFQKLRFPRISKNSTKKAFNRHTCPTCQKHLTNLSF